MNNTPRKALGWMAAACAVLALFLAGGLTLVNVPRAETEVAAAAAAFVDPYETVSLEATSAIVLDLKTNEVLFQHNANTQLPLASLTKVPLVLAVSEVLEPEAVVTLPRNVVGVGGTPPLGAGERWSIQDIVDVTLVASANSGAEVLADLADGPLRTHYRDAPNEATVWKMNQFAQGLGLSQTYFLNESGLDISTTLAGAYGSARDMAVLFGYAASTNPSLFSGTARGDVLLTSSDHLFRTTALNTNEESSRIPGLIMGKTGFTDLAGGNLAVVFDVGIARPVVAVVLGSTQEGRFTDMQKLVGATRAAIASQ